MCKEKPVPKRCKKLANELITSIVNFYSENIYSTRQDLVDFVARHIQKEIDYQKLVLKESPPRRKIKG